jgi:2-methylcitrate dehydratase PrpD
VIRLTDSDPPLTAGETTRLAWLTARMAKRGLAGEAVDLADLQKKFDAILNKARTRAEQEK